jgi:general stress protein YciG
MPNRPGNDDRSTSAGTSGVGDRGGQRDNSNDNARTGGSASASSQSRSRSNRGFASMDREKQREIASKGGRAAHAKGTAHEFDSGEAREAGRKGGVAVSRNREHMAAIGRRGGEARGQTRGRNPGQSNTAGSGNNAEGSFQNSRNSGANSDRQVAINNEQDGVTANTQGNRGGNASFNGERRPQGNEAASRNETLGNH